MPLPSDENQYRVYPVRWYLLFLFCFLAAAAAFQYNQFEPVYASFEFAFGWTVKMPVLVLLLAAIVTVVCIFPFALLLERYGLQRNMRIFAASSFLAYGIRCIAWRNGTFQAAVVGISSALNGLSGSLQAYLPLVLSARWFKPSERATATTIGIVANTVGLIAAPLLTTHFIPDPTVSKATRHQVQDAYFRFTWIETSVVTVAVIAVVVYFPDRPQKPPSPSAEDADKVIDLQGAGKVFKSTVFWRIALHYMAVAGGWFSWSPLISIDLSNNRVAQTPAAYSMAATQAAGAVGSLLLARLADHFSRSLKAVVVAASALTFLGSVWLVLTSHNYLAFSLREYSLASCIMTAGAVAVFTLDLELAAENLYPLDEALVAGLLMILLNVVAVIFTVILEFVPAESGWMDWYLLVSSGVGMLFAVLLPNVYRRLQTDTEGKNEPQAVTATAEDNAVIKGRFEVIPVP